MTWSSKSMRRVRLGLVFVVVYVLVAVAAPLFSTHDPYAMNADQVLVPPGFPHWLGTDSLGRDIFSRIVFGARRALSAAIPAVAVALGLGTLLGALAASAGKVIDSVVSRLLEIAFALPDVLLALVVIAILGPGQGSLILAIGIVYTPIFARIARSSLIEVQSRQFVEAARALGSSPSKIVLRHVLPNALAPILVQTTLSLAFAVLAEAALTYLGLGVEPDVPAWGMMLNQGRAWLERAWWVAVFPGVAIALLVFGLNALGDGLRDALDPRLASSLER